MDRNGAWVRGVIGFASVIGLIVAPFQAAEAHGSSRRHWRGSRHHDHDATVVVVLPRGAVSVRAHGQRLYYGRGKYYRQRWRDYVVVPAPAGVVVPSLPAGHRTIVVDGVTYHEYDGVYYKGGLAGYTMVPIAQLPAPRTDAAAPAQLTAAPAQEPVTVNVPNRNGSYTPVALQRTESGMYVGPQGEVYPNLPTEAQLRGMYAR